VSTLLDDITLKIAARVRAERTHRRWSLDDLAERSQVSKAMISKIERSEASPTAALLAKLSGAFELTLATLLTRAEAQGSRRIAIAEQALWRDPGVGYVRRQVFASGDHPVELVHIDLPPGAKVEFPAASYAFIRQVVWVLEGQLAITENGQTTRLAAGDAYAFGEPADSSFANPGSCGCAYLVAVSRR
jgi:transcriptional regulator with XRE-family HTH domain